MIDHQELNTALADLAAVMKAAIEQTSAPILARLDAIEGGASAAIPGLEKGSPAIADIDDDDDIPVYPAHLTVEERAALFDSIVQREIRATIARNPKLAAVPVDFAMLLETVTTVRTSIRWIKDRLDALEAAKSGGPLPYKGIWSPEATYPAGSFVSHGGGMWHANLDSKGVRPGDGSAAWTLAVKRGRDGKDATP